MKDTIKDTISRSLNVIPNRQVEDEFCDLCVEFMRFPRVVVMEIGVMYGATLAAFSLLQSEQFSSTPSITPVLIGIDNASWPVKMEAREYTSYVMKNLLLCGCSSNGVSIVVSDSNTDSCELAVAEILSGRKIDFLFIDADHEYTSVKSDYDRYSKYMGKGSIIAFHDIFKLKDRHVGSSVFWHEIRNKYDHLEIGYAKSTPPDWESGGVGVLYL
jgi:cephalosporin hydroxylase